MLCDMHHHVAYGIDDGAQTFEQMCDMLTVAVEDGIGDLVATPHATPGVREFKYDKYLEHLREARQWLDENGYPINLYTGCEILYTDDSARLLNDKKIPTIGGTRYVLVEFSPDAKIGRLHQAAQSLGRAGYYPIFAHVERYECLRKLSLLEELKTDYEVMLQVNASTAMERGPFRGWWFKQVMRMGLVDLISSDAHNVKSRRCKMRACCEMLKSDYGKKTAMRLCRDTALDILSNAKPFE